MKDNEKRERGFANKLLLGVAVMSGGLVGLAAPAVAQDGDSEIVVTGSRIVRQDYVANSPIATVTAEQITGNADVTLDTFLNSLPQVVPAGTSTSNNPGNAGQSNVNLRGLGSNRNLVLIDGRRPMVSAADQTVDLNTIPAALIETIEVITGGAGATYGADAVSGVVNLRLRDDFEGLDVSTSYSNSTEFWDAEEYNISLVAGGNFADGRGNGVIAWDRSVRQGMIKSQRSFAENATATTSFFPEGTLRWSGNGPTQAAVDSVFGTYGVAPGGALATSGLIGYNTDGTLFGVGIFNSPTQVTNFRYPLNNAVNLPLYPDVYSYNFDAVNILTLPLERTSFMSRVNYEFDNEIEVTGQVGWTEYSSATALAPTPAPTVTLAAPGFNTSIQGVSSLITPGSTIANQFVIPSTHPLISPNLRTLLDSRAGDNTSLIGAGAGEPFLLRTRFLGTGLRESVYENTVVQYLFGVNGPIGDTGWDFDVYVSEGTTEVQQKQTGNIDTNRVQLLLESPTATVAGCTYNPFGRQPLSQACIDYLEVSSAVDTEFTQQVAQAFITGEMFALPGGPASAVFGYEYRQFEYNLDPGSAAGPISGFNAQSPAGGVTTFDDLFTEFLFPVTDRFEIGAGLRYSYNEIVDTVRRIEADGSEEASYKLEANWNPLDPIRLRASYQRAVRAPNFGELFDSGTSAPQYFDPCSVTSAARSGANAAQLRSLCQVAGTAGGGAGLGGSVDTYVQTPGSQLQITIGPNTALAPEQADTYTIGLVFQSPVESGWLSRLSGSIDYYLVDITDAIVPTDVNGIVASCYNFFGTNPTYSAANPNCAGLVRSNDLLLILNSAAGSGGVFQRLNEPKLSVEGIDFQLDYGFDIEGAGAVHLNMLLNHTMSVLSQVQGQPEFDFAGTVTFFGAGLGTSYPEWRGTFNAGWEVGPFGLNYRARYIGEMSNRMGVLFPGERFTGTDAIWYHDIGASWDVTENAEFRIGVNNVADEQPPSYAPNAQSGTDPSTFDVVGRRAYAQVNLRF